MPDSPLLRAVRAAGSLLVLAGLVVGLPLALALLAGNPLPDGVPTMEAIGDALTSPDDGTLFLGVLTVVGWLAWASFTGSVLIELIARLTRRRTPSIPGLGGPQRLVLILVSAIAALAVTPTVASASAAVVDSGPAISAPVDPSDAQRSPARSAAGGSDAVLHLVERGEGLLDLQDRYGVAWHRIAEANYGVPQPDGRSLQQGQTRIYPGWQLRIPTSATPGAVEAPRIAGLGAADRSPTAAASLADTTAPTTAQPARYEIAEGDWLWHIAERYLGDPERYDEIAALNPRYADQHGDFP
ncbi:MAG: LysM peptidoglycan-binding domain-containing protein, partial [Natronosporangium sp.]